MTNPTALAPTSSHSDLLWRCGRYASLKWTTKAAPCGPPLTLGSSLFATPPRWYPIFHNSHKIPILSVGLVALSFSMGTAVIEVATVLMALACIVTVKRIPKPSGSLVLYALLVLSSVRVWQDGTEVLGKIWLFAPLLFLPPLLGYLSTRERENSLFLASIGLGLLSLLGVWQWVQGGVGHGIYSHHLSFGYVLLMPLSYTAFKRKWALLALLFAGILSTEAQGPIFSSVCILFCLWFSPKRVLMASALVMCGLFLILKDSPEFQERLQLWGSAFSLLQDHPMGTGVSRFRALYTISQSQQVPPLYFPLHAHDSYLQQALWFGIPIWVAWGMFVREWWGWSKWGRAMMIGIFLGAFTEDTLGDMEILRIFLVFGCFASVENNKSEREGIPQPMEQAG